jgi:hypothetical protein
MVLAFMDYGVNLAWLTIKDIVVQYPGFSIGKTTKAINNDVRFNTNDQVHKALSINTWIKAHRRIGGLCCLFDALKNTCNSTLNIEPIKLCGDIGFTCKLVGDNVAVSA